MADQGKWFKLWCSALYDPSLANLPNEDWARWAKLGAYIKQHGTSGKVIVQAPALALQALFQVMTFESVITAIKRFPNCRVGERMSTVSGETNITVSLDVEYLNWMKYQGDLSSERVRQFRAKMQVDETVQEEKRSRRDVEEKRKDNTPQTPLGGSIPYLRFQNLWNDHCGPLPKAEVLTDKRKKLLRLRWAEKPDLTYWQNVVERISRSRFCCGDSNTGWRASFDWLLRPDTSVKVMEGKYDNREGPYGANDRSSAVDYAALARAKRASEKVRTISSPRAIPGRSGDLSDAETKAESSV